MNRSEQDAVARGREAWQRLKGGQTWEDWCLTGTALMIGRDECLTTTHANDLDNKRYRNAFGQWLEANGFADMDKGARARLFECMEHRAAIEVWRASVLTLDQRLQLNHPNSVLRKWKASTVEGKATKAPAKPGLREEVARLQDELDEANRKLRKAKQGDDRGPMITRTDATADMVRVLLEWLPKSKQHPVASGLMRALKSTEARR